MNLSCLFSRFLRKDSLNFPKAPCRQILHRALKKVSAGEKASFTVEAAFICPLILMILAALLIDALCLHDRVLERTALSLEIAAEANFREYSEEADSILGARIYSRENTICMEKGPLRISGSVGDYRESRPRIRPEEIFRKKALFTRSEEER